MTSLRRWVTFTAISLSLASVDTYPVLASDTGVPLPSAVEYALTEPVTGGAHHKDNPLPDDRQVVLVIANEFHFVPNVVQIQHGQSLTLELKNEGKETHNLTFKTISLKTPEIPPGTGAELPLPSTLAPGRYPFVCTVPGHVQRGMSGVLVVK